MKLLNESEVSRCMGEILCREVRLGKWIALLVCLSFASAGLIAFFRPNIFGQANPLREIMMYAAPFSFLVTLVAMAPARKSLGPSNWLLRIRRDGLLVKFRSYLNAHFPGEDRVVVQLDWSDVQYVQKHLQTQTRQMGDGEVTDRLVFLNIRLRLTETARQELASALEQERKRQPTEGMVRTTHRHYPIRLMPDDMLRIEWRSPQSRVGPGIQLVLAMMGRDCEVREPDAEADNDPKSDEEKLLDLLSRGDQLSAIKLARRMYGFDLNEARRFVDELTGGNMARPEPVDTTSAPS